MLLLALIPFAKLMPFAIFGLFAVGAWLVLEHGWRAQAARRGTARRAAAIRSRAAAAKTASPVKKVGRR